MSDKPNERPMDTSSEFFIVYGNNQPEDRFGALAELRQTLAEARELADRAARRRGDRVFIAKVIEWSEVPVARGSFGGQPVEHGQ